LNFFALEFQQIFGNKHQGEKSLSMLVCFRISTSFSRKAYVRSINKIAILAHSLRNVHELHENHILLENNWKKSLQIKKVRLFLFANLRLCTSILKNFTLQA